MATQFTYQHYGVLECHRCGHPNNGDARTCVSCEDPLNKNTSDRIRKCSMCGDHKVAHNWELLATKKDWYCLECLRKADFPTHVKMCEVRNAASEFELYLHTCRMCGCTWEEVGHIDSLCPSCRNRENNDAIAEHTLKGDHFEHPVDYEEWIPQSRLCHIGYLVQAKLDGQDYEQEKFITMMYDVQGYISYSMVAQHELTFTITKVYAVK